jgi:hypothetical protein
MGDFQATAEVDLLRKGHRTAVHAAKYSTEMILYCDECEELAISGVCIAAAQQNILTCRGAA